MKLSVLKEVGNFLTNIPTILFSRSILFSEGKLRTEAHFSKEIQNTPAHQSEDIRSLILSGLRQLSCMA
jgi:hypothetical protein